MNTENNFQNIEHENDFLRFLEIKTERLVTAVYLITNFLSDKEPIKWKLRDICLQTLSHASVLKEKDVSERSNLLAGILASGGEIISLLEIAHVSGFISEMNCVVLKREYATLMEMIAAREEVKKSIHKVSLPTAFFEDIVGEKYIPRFGERVDGQGTPALRAVGTKDSVRMREGNTFNVNNVTDARARDIKDKHERAHSIQNDFLNYTDKKDISGSGDVQREEGRELGRVERAKNKRRDSIIQILKDKDDLTIKDITTKITDCSEKTIQRELVTLVQNGILKKTGERRWSRYSLV